MEGRKAILLHEKDNVANLIEDAETGDTILIIKPSGEIGIIQALDSIPFGFKIAVREIKKGEWLLKYGQTIGLASKAISIGDMVHVHNIEGIRGRGDRQEEKNE